MMANAFNTSVTGLEKELATLITKDQIEKIPAHVSIVLQEIVTLRDRYRNVWQVKAREIDGVWYFLDGWAKFVADSSVALMDVLAFTYSGPGSFDVNIIGPGGDMKDGVGYNKTYNSKEHQNMEIVISESEDVDTFVRVSSDYNEGGSRKLHKKKRTVDYLSQGILRKGSYSMKRMKPVNINESDNKGKGIRNESSDKDSDSDYWPYDSYVEIPEDFRSGNCRTKRLKSKTRDVKAAKSINRVDYLGKKLFTSGGIPRPEFKYFVTRMKPRRRNELYIPKDILMDENLKIPKKIKLVDTAGNTYTSRRKKWKDGRRFYKGGWNRLGKRNHLTEHDLCICEFGERDQTGFLFISFVRKAAK